MVPADHDLEPTRTRTSSSLLVHLRANNADAWQDFISLYAASVYSRCRQLGLDPHAADEASQEVFERVFRNIPKFEHRGPGSFRAWLGTITTNVIRDAHRRKKHAATVNSVDPALIETTHGRQAHDDTDFSEELVDLVHRAMDMVQGEFSKATWQTFRLFHLEGRSSGEIAAQLDLTEHAVRQRVYRVMSRLKRLLCEAV